MEVMSCLWELGFVKRKIILLHDLVLIICIFHDHYKEGSLTKARGGVCSGIVCNPTRRNFVAPKVHKCASLGLISRIVGTSSMA